MKKKNTLILFLATFLLWNNGFGQCSAGEGELTMIVHTDDYGYEGYWEIVPAGNNCGTGTIGSGGNPLVGCGGAGAQTQNPGGYGNNTAIPEGPWCLPLGDCFDLYFIDDWGDGGFTCDMFIDGVQIESFEVEGQGGVYSFCVEAPNDYDLSVFAANQNAYVSGPYDLTASVFNFGGALITSYDLNYSVDGGATQTHNVTGASLGNYQAETVDHSIPVTVLWNGSHNIKIWTDNFNGGNADMYTLNDTLNIYFESGPGVPNIIDGYVNASVTVNQIAGSAEQVNSPTDLDFHPILTNNELWVCNKGTEASGGSTVTIYDAGLPAQNSIYKQDGNAWHFMSLPTGIAFSENGNWANSPGVFDANHNGGAAFTGPSLWSSHMGIYGENAGPGTNGSHLDMLHLSPESQGIAAEKANVFWVFDGYTSDIVRYDFAEDHGPGNSYHGDAIIRRYSDDAVAKDPADQVVSHLVLDENKQWLYVVDHGNGRVIRIDINTGSDQGGAPNYPANEGVAEYTEYTGYAQETAVTGLVKPAGIDVIGNRMIVSEYQSGEIIIYDITSMPAVELDRINTGYSSVQGIKIGPNGLIWFVDEASNGVYRINSGELSLDELSLDFEVYPSPSKGEIKVRLNDAVSGKIEVRDLQGKLILSTDITGQTTTIDLDAVSGMYFVQVIQNEMKSETKRIIIQ